MKTKNLNGPMLYKSTLGLPAYRKADGEEIFVLNFPFELKELKQDGSLQEEGEFFIFEGYASTWALDLGDDMIMPGAFKESLQKRKPKVLAFHDPDVLAGFHDEDLEDEIGLRVKGRIPKNGGNTPLIVPYMGPGGIDSLSIGFRIARNDDGEPMMDIIDGKRILKKIDLFEYSFVTFPMNPSAKVGLLPEQSDQHPEVDDAGNLIDVKPRDPQGREPGSPGFGTGPKKSDEIDFETIRAAESCLKEFGFTNEQAKTFISKTKALSKNRDDKGGVIEGLILTRDADEEITDDLAKSLVESLAPAKIEGLEY